MPCSYDCVCEKCGKKTEQFHSIKEGHAPCPHCGGKMMTDMSNWTHGPAVSAPDMFWENENNGRGRYIGSIGDHKDPHSYCRSRTEAKEKLVRKGYSSSQVEFA